MEEFLHDCKTVRSNAESDPRQGESANFRHVYNGYRDSRTGEVPLLLVDAEDAIAPGHSVWQHLKARDNWDRPSLTEEDQAFLMVRIMETWFLADRTLLRDYFGPQLREHHLKQWPALEEVPKQTVLTALELATADCQRKYAKGRVSYELLGRVNPTLVETTCPHARDLLVRLRGS